MVRICRLPRHHNYVWEQLAADELWARFHLSDGHHLPPSGGEVHGSSQREWRPQQFSRAMPISAAGMPPGRYRLGAVDIVVQPNYRAERADGAGSGILAGSAIDLLRGVENVIRFAGRLPFGSGYDGFSQSCPPDGPFQSDWSPGATDWDANLDRSSNGMPDSGIPSAAANHHGGYRLSMMPARPERPDACAYIPHCGTPTDRLDYVPVSGA